MMIALAVGIKRHGEQEYTISVAAYSQQMFLSCSSFLNIPGQVDRLVGLVVKASTSGAEDPWFESRLCRDFSGVQLYQ